MGKPLIVGIGSHHADDAVGWLVAEDVARRVGDAAVVRAARCPADLLDWLPGMTRLLVCDGCRGSGPPGLVRRWTWPFAAPALDWSGTHPLGLLEVISLADRLGKLPRDVDVWTVEVERNGADQALSSSVVAAVPKAAAAIALILRETVH